MKKCMAILLCVLTLISGVIMANAAFSSQVSLDFNALDASNMWNFTTKLGAYSPGISNGVLKAINSVKGHGGFFASEAIKTPAVFEFDVLLTGTNKAYEMAYVGFRLDNNTDNPSNSAQGVWMFLGYDALYVRSQGEWGDMSGSGFSLPRLEFEQKYYLDKPNADGTKKRIRFYDGGGSTIYIYISLDCGATWEPVGEVRNCVSNSRVTVYDMQNGKNNARGSADVKTLQNPGYIGIWLHEHTYVAAEFANVLIANVSSNDNGRTYSYTQFKFKDVSAQAITVDNAKMTIAASVPYDARLWEMAIEPVAGQTVTVDGKNIANGTVNLYAPDGKASSHTVKCGTDEYTMTLYQQGAPANTGDYIGVRDLAIINAADSTLITDYCSIEDYYDGYEEGNASGIIYAHIKDGVKINKNMSVYFAHIKSTAESRVDVAGNDISLPNKVSDWSIDDTTILQYLTLDNSLPEDHPDYKSYLYEVYLSYEDFEVVNNNRLTTTTLSSFDYTNGRNFQQDIFNGVAKDVEGKSYIEFDSVPLYGELINDANGHAVVYMPELILGTREESLSYTVYDAEGTALAIGRANVISGSVNEARLTSPIFTYSSDWGVGEIVANTDVDGGTFEFEFYAQDGDILSLSTMLGKEQARASIVVTDESGKQVFEDRIDCYYWAGDTAEAIKEMSQPRGFGAGGTWSVVDGENVYTPHTFKEGLYHVKLTVNTDGYTANAKRFGVGFVKIGKADE